MADDGRGAPTGRRRGRGKPKPETEEVKKPEEKKEPEPDVVELLRKRLEDVSARSHKFAREIERLRAEAKKHTHDTDKMVKWLEDEVKRREMANKKLTKQFKEETEKQANAQIRLKKQYEATLKRAEQVFLQKESQLLERNKQLMQEVSDLSLFKKMKADLATELDMTKQMIHKNELRHKNQLDEMQKKFVQDEAKLRKEAADRIAHSRMVYKEEVGKELDQESKLVRRQNREMAKELKFHESRSNELQRENTRVYRAIKKYKMDLALVLQKEEEYAKRGLRQGKQIKEFSDRVKVLERSLTQVLRDFELEREAKDAEYRSLREESEQELYALRNENSVKSREIRNLKKHARALLAQRNEVEQFFLESLEQVKDEMRQKRESDYRAAKAAHNRQIRQLALPRGIKFPSITAFENVQGTAPRPPSKRVDLKDLTLEDRERVLRLLFAKINNAPQQKQLPPHSFDIELGDQSSYPPSRQSNMPLSRGGAGVLSRTSTAGTGMEGGLGDMSNYPADMLAALPPEMPPPPPADPSPSDPDERGSGMTFLTDMNNPMHSNRTSSSRGGIEGRDL